MTQKLQYAIDFATTCVKHDIKPHDLAQFCTQAEKVYSMGLKALYHKDQINKDNHAKAKKEFEVLANQLGYSVSYTGNWPSLFKNGADIYLPQ